LTKEGKSGLSGNSKEGIRPALTSDKRDLRKVEEVTLTAQEKLFLDDVYTHQLSTINDRYLRLALSIWKGNKLQKSLCSKGLITSINISTASGVFKGLLLTGKGEKALGKKPSQSNRAGGSEHKFWLRATAQHLRKQGFAVTEEAPIGNGKTIDVLAVKDGRKTAFEIETGKSDIASNIKKVRSAGLTNFYIVATSTKVKQKCHSKKMINFPNIKVLFPGDIIQQKIKR